MKNRVRKMILLGGMLLAMSLAVCACGGEKETLDAESSQSSLDEPAPEDEGQEKEPDEEAGPEGAGAEEKPESPEVSAGPETGGEDKRTDSTQKEQPEVQNMAAEWDNVCNLEGDIKELKDGQFTVIEAFTEQSDNGGSVLVLPADSTDDSEFSKNSVTYDENTLFAIRTIYDGGARSELTEATSADLAIGQFVRVWGSFSGSELQAAQILIVKVA